MLCVFENFFPCRVGYVYPVPAGNQAGRQAVKKTGEQASTQAGNSKSTLNTHYLILGS